jgi:hypothetical protein
MSKIIGKCIKMSGCKNEQNMEGMWRHIREVAPANKVHPQTDYVTPDPANNEFKTDENIQ